jgi:antitoxin MazE9
MKLSVSLSDEDVAVLDAYVEEAGLPSRSAGVQRAVQLLRYPALEDDYEQAWAQWSSDEQAEWESTSGDGIDDAAR